MRYKNIYSFVVWNHLVQHILFNIKLINISFGMQIDAVAKSRDGKFRIVSNDEREQTLNQLLTVSIPLTFSVSCECKETNF